MGLFSQNDFKSKYDVGKELGRGNFAVVKECTQKENGIKRAVKILTVQNDEEYGHIKAEIAILEKLKHPSIIQMVEIFEKRSNRGKPRVYIVMELVTGGELFDRIVEKKNFSEGEARRVLRTVLQSLEYAKEEGIAHRDLKPENILLETRDENSQVKIADWGLSKLYLPTGQDDATVQAMMTMCGTPGYVAPEVISSNGYNAECDIWSSGVILYVMLCGFLPFQSSDRNRLFSKIKKGAYKLPSPYWDGVSDEAKDLLALMLTVDPRKRVTATQALKHPWMEIDAPGASLDSSMMAKYQSVSHAKKKWNSFIHTVKALNRLRSIV